MEWGEETMVGSSDSDQAGEMVYEEPRRQGADNWQIWKEITQVGGENEKFTNTCQGFNV